MNKKEVIAQVSEKSGFDTTVCEKVIDAYEKQFGDTLLKKIKGVKNNCADLTASISQTTNILSSDCETILSAFEEVFGEGLSGKLKFWK